MTTMKLPSSYKDPKIFNNKYIVKGQISSGSFGVVYLAFDKITKEEVAIKLEKEENEDVCTLEREVQVLQQLGILEGVPRYYWSGLEQDYNVLVIQLLGKDLSHYMKQQKQFSIKTVLQLAQQLLAVMQRIHAKGVIHRDLKPENILVGKGDDTSSIYLVDYGVSKIYLDSHGNHIPFKEKKSFIGTTRYASIAAHRGYELGRKDDIESLFYVLIYFVKGKLPWQNLQNIGDRDRTEVVGEYKMKTELTELCQNLPVEIINIFKYLQTLEFKSEPNYSLIQDYISRAASNYNLILDRTFDWSEKATITKSGDSRHDLKSDHQLPISHSKELLLPMEKQHSGQLLKPPEPKTIGKQGAPRLEQRQGSVLSVQASCSSMQIKYIPSRMDAGSQMPKEENEVPNNKKKFLQQQSQHINNLGVPNKMMLQQQHSMEIRNNIPIKLESQPIITQKQQMFNRKRTNESTWGYRAGEMDEYMDDSPRLGDKFLTLQRQGVNAYLNHRVHPKQDKTPKNKSCIDVHYTHQ